MVNIISANWFLLRYGLFKYSKNTFQTFQIKIVSCIGVDHNGIFELFDCSEPGSILNI